MAARLERNMKRFKWESQETPKVPQLKKVAIHAACHDFKGDVWNSCLVEHIFELWLVKSEDTASGQVPSTLEAAERLVNELVQDRDFPMGCGFSEIPV